ncbi:PorP/SprF family type IX secretion system membrane protein [Muricauda sp. 334s03]|uniref:PorP/SprF family type IX secretion system membrane protein n=1 Tax=Flagellimonas yonaguniensis TaxID=3031325 RepID=A0ABT5XUF6_9FLAO|nr:PorP/SprF family type IX secretion system membrane protein [[Muricauda] yonaguniensis]MDF0714815.1 PorP/SprF family type IX secretion system membrane protein [[Muricauda] yonaguniensis]
MQINKPLLLLAVLLLAFSGMRGQEEEAYVPYNVPSQNLLKFNRFLLNPTFSTVREDKSYINLFHRNQSVSFDDNNQVYFLSYSGRVSDRSGVGVSLFTNREGLFNNFGVHANYAYGVRLSPKSTFTFGANVSYYQSAFNQDRANSVEVDPLLSTLESSSLVSFQPGFNLSIGKFDIGGFAENLFDYNLKTSESVTDFNEKTYSGHLQYTHQFENGRGIMESARLMPLARVRKVGEENITLGGNLILDLPKLGWVQAGYDDYYGASAGLGFNLTKNISLGYTVEKGLSNEFENFGVTHEISLAYSFTPNLTEDRVMLEKDDEALVSNDEDVPQDSLNITDKDIEIAQLQEKLAENDAILDELLMRQDSIESTRKKDLERRFETVMKMVKRETRGQNPVLEEKAKQVYFANMDTADIVTQRRQPLANHGLSNNTSTKKVIKINEANDNTKASYASNSKAKKDNTYRSVRSKKATGLKSHSVPNVESGHYLIANVFRDTDNLNNFIEKLRSQGIEADYFQNPKNGLNYVYIGDFSNKNEALDAYHSKMDGAYQGDAWLMNVNGGNSQIAGYTGEVDNKGSKYGNNLLSKNVTNNPKGKRHVVISSQSGEGLAEGYYIIANVFENSSSAKEFVKELNSKGLHASYFISPQDKHRYVYLKKHETWNNALTSYYTKLNASYNDEMWIMRIKPNTTI